MSIIIKENSTPQVAAGTYLAIAYGIIDIGTQPDTGFGEKQKVLILFELPTERMTFDGIEKPLAISAFYGKSLSKKANLRKDLVAWRGREFTKEELEGFELKNILGKACQVSVIVNENGKSRIDGIVALMKGTQVPGVTNLLVEYSVHDGKNRTYATLPEWIRKLCDACIEWDTTRTTDPEPEPESPIAPADDDIPF